jgi:endonuclease/exonuclease/phosphatase family metal-dependent hydrolase
MLDVGRGDRPSLPGFVLAISVFSERALKSSGPAVENRMCGCLERRHHDDLQLSRRFPLYRMRSLTAAAVGTTMLVSLVAMAIPAEATAVKMPARISAVTATAGPLPGEVTFHWKQSNSATTSYSIETGLTSFKVGDSRLPDHGRDSHVFTAPASATSLTLTAAQVKAAGAGMNSSNHLYYRFKAVNKTSHGTATRKWPYQQSVAVAPEMPNIYDTDTLRFGSFNIRSTKAPGHSWLSRASLVAKTIVAQNPGILAVQELGPGRADGKSGTTTGHLRQTDSLIKSLAAAGGSKYKLVRDTSYVEPGKTEGSQGARIVYDSSKYTLLTDCPNTSSAGGWSTACSIALPIRASDSTKIRRRGSYAQFEDKNSGKRFWVASLHLDERHSTKSSTEKSYEALRGKQMATVIAKMKSLDTNGEPTFIAGDLNSWQNNQHGDKAHDALISAGYYDTAAAKTQVNIKYTTFNNFVKTIPVNPSGWGARLDVIAVKGITGADKFENVMTRTSTHRPSDHNMVYADVRLP